MTAWSMFWILQALACSGEKAPDCSSLVPGLERDSCYAVQLKALPATDAPGVETIARKIDDPLVLQEAVSTWVGTHVGDLAQEDGKRLCALLTGRDAAYCLRRLSSPHLQR